MTAKKKKVGHPKQFTEVEKQKALRMIGMGFTVRQAAYVLGLNKKTIEENTTQEERDGARASAHVQLVNTAYKQALEGSERMLIFLLKTQMGWSEGQGDLELKYQYEKRLLDYKKEIGYTEYTSAPIEIHLSAPATRTRDYDRNTIEANPSGADNTILGIDALDGQGS